MFAALELYVYHLEERAEYFLCFDARGLEAGTPERV